MNKIFLENCIKTLTNRDIEYDYVFTGPPDFHEVGISPSNPNQYKNFLKEIFGKFTPKKNVVTIVITDRKYNSTIIPKHMIINEIFSECGWNLYNHKIWVKTDKVDWFRLTYSHILVYTKGKIKQNKYKPYFPDVWMVGKIPVINGFTNGMPLDIPERCILNFTNEGDIVYDPFMGTGTTALACIKYNRYYYGSEISKEIYFILQKRLNNVTAENLFF